MRSQQVKKKGVRDYAAYLVLGGKGKGKTTLLMDLIEIYLTEFLNNRVFVHDPSNAFHEIKFVVKTIEELEEILKSEKWKKGAIRFIGSGKENTQKMHELLGEYLTDAAVVFDEWSEYVLPNPTDWQMKMLIKHRNSRIEVFYVGHGLLDVPPKFVRGSKINRIILLDTGEEGLTENDLKKYACRKKLFPAYERVQAAPEQDTFTQYFEIIDV